MKARIGFLSLAHMHAAGYAGAVNTHAEAEIAGVWDADAGRAREFASKYGTRAYGSAEELLEGKPDGVVVASENVYHKTLTCLAARAGVRAILCEKPLATTLQDAREMVTVCEREGTVLATAFPCRLSPVFQRGLARVRAGDVGDVLAVRGTNRGTLPGGWFTDLSLAGGGAVIDHAVHVADLNRLLFGAEVMSVFAEIGNGFSNAEWDDTGFLAMNYAGGGLATLDASWSRPPGFPTWGDVNLQVVGTNGVLDLELFGQNLAVYCAGAKDVEWVSWGSGLDGILMGKFVDVLQGKGGDGLATGVDGLRALEVAVAAYVSGRTGQVVEVASLD